MEDGIIQLFVGDIGRLVNVDRVGVVKAATGRTAAARTSWQNNTQHPAHLEFLPNHCFFIWNFFPYNSDDLPAIPCGGLMDVCVVPRPLTYGAAVSPSLSMAAIDDKQVEQPHYRGNAQ